MNKIFIASIIVISIIFMTGKLTESASAAGINFNNYTKIGSNLNFLDNNQNAKEKFQERTTSRNGDEDFMIKGVITASSSNSLTINSRLINIDSSVSGNIKIVGNVQTGAYAMVKGVIKDTSYYATRIVIDQRNKQEQGENDKKNDHLSPTPTVSSEVTLTPTPTLTASPTPMLTASESAAIQNQITFNWNFGDLITRVQTFLDYLKGLAAKI